MICSDACFPHEQTAALNTCFPSWMSPVRSRSPAPSSQQFTDGALSLGCTKGFKTFFIFAPSWGLPFFPCSALTLTYWQRHLQVHQRVVNLIQGRLCTLSHVVHLKQGGLGALSHAAQFVDDVLHSHRRTISNTKELTKDAAFLSKKTAVCRMFFQRLTAPIVEFQNNTGHKCSCRLSSGVRGHFEYDGLRVREIVQRFHMEQHRLRAANAHLGSNRTVRILARKGTQRPNIGRMTGKRVVAVSVKMTPEDAALLKKAANALWPGAPVTRSSYGGSCAAQQGREEMTAGVKCPKCNKSTMTQDEHLGKPMVRAVPRAMTLSSPDAPLTVAGSLEVDVWVCSDVNCGYVELYRHKS